MSVQMVVLMPLLFGIAFTGMQAGLFFYGRSAALSAATTGARAAAAERGTTTACHRAAEAFLAQLGDVLTDPSIDCTRNATTVTVRVAGTTLSVIPGWQPRAEQVAVKPVERITR
ncbi:MAG: TadE/TadG family type IV pilus assembly protein [Propionicimonas sp.]|uniref:TadE/TadG family type IV pilus assembly protein n=1 Tax=Propionicimonas sp. TaxID=1955623 RepID=UPI003D10ECE8